MIVVHIMTVETCMSVHFIVVVCWIVPGFDGHNTHNYHHRGATVARRYRFKELHCSHRRARPVQRCNDLVKPVIYTGVAKSGIIRITAFRPGETILKPAITRFNSLV